MLYRILKAIFIIPIWLIFRPRVTGLKRLLFRGKGIIISNHHSLCDPIWLGIVTPRAIHFMAKKELFQKRTAGAFLKLLGAFPVDRQHADIASLKKAITVLESGGIFGIFPEGKRSITGELDTFEKGAAFLALRCGAPIIPVYSDPKMYRRLRIRMIVGEVIDPKAVSERLPGKSADALAMYIRDCMQQLKNRMEEGIQILL